MRSFITWTLGGLLITVAGCPSSAPGVCDDGACEPADGGTDVAEGGVVQPPAGCDPAAEPKDAPKCVVSGFGVFVDAAGGADANAGTRESPVKTIGAALGKLGGKPRVYVCEGTYTERVKLASAVALYGGFACGGGATPASRRRSRPPTRALRCASTRSLTRS